MKGKIIISNIYNPYYNLALEEFLIDRKENILYLWQNDKTVVIGRNQNPYKECNVEIIKRDKINLARRKSGGGTVYHDLGNLNYTIISKKNNNLNSTNIDDNFRLIIKALSTIGINSNLSGRNDIVHNNKKFSGSAFYEKGNIFCHHGTLLVDLDMDKLDLYLKPSKLKLESKGIDSVRTRVVNLKEIDDKINIDRINSSLIETYRGFYDHIDIEYVDSLYFKKNKDLMKLVEAYNSWDWIYGQSPKANLSLEKKFPWGIVQFDFNIIRGIIRDANIYTDSIINDDFYKLSKIIEGKRFEKEIIIKQVKKTLFNEDIKNDLIIYIDSLDI